MKKYLFLVMVLLSSSVFADVYVVYNKKDGSVHSLSPMNDAVIEYGMDMAKLSGDLEDYGILYTSDVYDYQDGGLKLNRYRLDEKSKKEHKAQKEKEELELIRKQMMKDAYDKLIAEGTTFEYVTEEVL